MPYLIEKSSYVPRCPREGWHSVGYILMPSGRCLLVRNDHAGKFAALDNTGTLIHLETGAVAGELWAATQRTPKIKSQLIRMDEDLIQFAKMLGNGNFSEGVRIALRSLQQ